MITQEQLDIHEAIINKKVTGFADKGDTIEFNYNGKTYTAKASHGTWDRGSIKAKSLISKILGK